MQKICVSSIITSLWSGIVWGGAFFVVPQFKQIFSDLKLPLPEMTAFICMVPRPVWLVLAIATMVWLLTKDFYVTKLRTIHWINAIATVAMFCCALLLTVGLFVPLICTIQVLR